MSPLVPRPRPADGGGADPAVRALAQRWFARLGSDVGATLDPAALAELVGELRSLQG